MNWSVGAGEEARLTPGGPTAAVIESRGWLPLRVRRRGPAASSVSHPGTAVVLGKETFEVVAEGEAQGRISYQLEPWPKGQTIRDRVVYGPRFVQGVLEERRRASRERWAGPVLGAVRRVLDVAAALLPEPERLSTSSRLSLDPVRGTLLLLLLQLGGGGALWVAGFVSAQQARLEAVAGKYTREGTAPSDAEVRQAYAPFKGGSDTWSPVMLGPMAYVLGPRGLVLEYVFFTGLLRAFHLVTSRQPLGDPALALLFGGLRSRHARRRERSELLALGPERPDRVLEDGRDVVIVASRPKPDWCERATVAFGERLFEVRHVALAPDGDWQAYRYRLTPHETGRIVRGAVLPYAPPSGRPASHERDAEAEAPLASSRRAPTAESVPRAAPVTGAGQRRWRVDEGEEARLTPGGPSTAVIESRGALPFRLRSEAMGVHNRPEFPGSCVVVGGLRFEVVAEQGLLNGFRYLLDPWPADAVIRGMVSYGPPLVRAAQRERQDAFDRERAARWSFVVAPFVGLLPEERQLLACDRLSLDPQLTTFAGVSLELAAAMAAAVSVKAGAASMLIGEGFGIFIVAPALFRLLGLVLMKETAGAWWLNAVFEATASLASSSTARADASVLPLTRDAFWSRLARPDRQQRGDDGSVVVSGLLPHLSWSPTAATRMGGVLPALRVGSDYWSVSALPADIENGRLQYAYHLWPRRDENMLAGLPDPAPPDVRQYQNEVLEDVARQWDDIFGAAPWLPCLLPRAAQERAYRGRGGAPTAQRWTVLTALALSVVGAWMLFGRDPFSVLTGLVLLGESGYRVWRTLSGDYAPSLMGLALSDYLVPERKTYQEHLQAERSTLLEKSRTPSAPKP